MKHTIEGFSQQYALTLKTDVDVKKGDVVKKVERQIDCTDLVILRWFVDFYPNMKKIEVDGKQYAWLTHKKLIEDLPLIDINKRAFIDRMQKLVFFDILTYKFLKDGGGTVSLYGFGKNYNNLISDMGCTVEHTRGMQLNDNGVYGQSHTEDKSIIDTSIKDNNIYIAVLDYFNEKAGTRFRAVESNLKFIKARLNDGYTEQDLKSVIDKKVKEWKGTAMQHYLRPETLFNATKFESYMNGLETAQDKKNVSQAHEYMEHNYTEQQLRSAMVNFDDWEDEIGDDKK